MEYSRMTTSISKESELPDKESLDTYMNEIESRYGLEARLICKIKFSMRNNVTNITESKIKDSDEYYPQFLVEKEENVNSTIGISGKDMNFDMQVHHMIRIDSSEDWKEVSEFEVPDGLIEEYDNIQIRKRSVTNVNFSSSLTSKLI